MQMFDGNLNDNDVVENTLPYPIVARYIRINPQRWARFISLRVEFYGCRFGRLPLNISMTLPGACRSRLKPYV